jgi:hypothetical protein
MFRSRDFDIISLSMPPFSLPYAHYFAAASRHLRRPFMPIFHYHYFRHSFTPIFDYCHFFIRLRIFLSFRRDAISLPAITPCRRRCDAVSPAAIRHFISPFDAADTPCHALRHFVIDRPDIYRAPDDAAFAFMPLLPLLAGQLALVSFRLR